MLFEYLWKVEIINCGLDQLVRIDACLLLTLISYILRLIGAGNRWFRRTLDLNEDRNVWKVYFGDYRGQIHRWQEQILKFQGNQIKIVITFSHRIDIGYIYEPLKPKSLLDRMEKLKVTKSAEILVQISFRLKMVILNSKSDNIIWFLSEHERFLLPRPIFLRFLNRIHHLDRLSCILILHSTQKWHQLLHVHLLEWRVQGEVVNFEDLGLIGGVWTEEWVGSGMRLLLHYNIFGKI